MEPIVEKMSADLNRLCRLLDDGALLSFTPEESRRLTSEGRMFIQRLEAIESGFLTVGLIGGTGVGKSTLMNALAGKEIAASGDRRPHTDRILIYKHETTHPQLLKKRADLPLQAISHTSDEIQGIVLCDLPDFDSIIDAHRRQVLDFLVHLDVLIWVTSIEKYADSRFYEFLETIPKAKNNYCFVLNKADQCFEGQPAQQGYKALENVIESFQKHIQQKGIDKPLLYPLSAKMAFDNAPVRPWNQFEHFSRQIFQQKNFKEITAIKAANLDAEIGQYLSHFKKERQNLKIFEQILDAALIEISERRQEWVEAGQKAISRWTDQYLKHSIVNRQGDISCLVGPGYGIGLLYETWSHRLDTAGRGAARLSVDKLPEELAELFKQRVQWIMEKLHHQRAHHFLPDSFEKKIHQAIAPEILSDDMIGRFRQVFSFYLTEPKDTFRLFVASQRSVYGIVFILFLMAIGGRTGWHRMIDTPEWESLFHLIISMFYTLFSQTGLAALGSLVLINLFLGFRFFHQYRRRREKAAEKILEGLNRAGGSVWLETMADLTENIKRIKTEFKNRLKDLPKV